MFCLGQYTYASPPICSLRSVRRHNAAPVVAAEYVCVRRGVARTYLMAILKISFLDSFLSCGWVGTSLRSSANAPVTLCWRHRSRELVTVHGFRESGCTGYRRTPAADGFPDGGSASSPDVRSSDVRSHSSSDPNSATTRDDDESSRPASLNACCVCWFFGMPACAYGNVGALIRLCAGFGRVARGNVTV